MIFRKTIATAGVVAALLLSSANMGGAFVLSDPDARWPSASIDFHVRLANGLDFDSGFSQAIDLWNDNSVFTINKIQDAVGACSVPTAENNNFTINGVAFRSTQCDDEPYGDMTLAVQTTWNFVGGPKIQGSIIFNSNETWSVYSGPFQNDPADFRRVAVHELGHTIGLKHEETNPAIMAATVVTGDTIEVPQADDIAGVDAMYGSGGGTTPPPPATNAPANDNFADAIEISGDNVAVTGSNVDASEESGEPNHAGKTTRTSVWWKWTAPSAGAVTVTTDGSTFDTVLAIYTGSGVSALSEVASDDDSGEGLRSTASFTASSGTTYRIAVDGFSGATGTIALALTLESSGTTPPPGNAPANDNFADAITLTGNIAFTQGTNVDATKEAGEPSHAGNAGGASVWYSWTAITTGTTIIDTGASGFDTLLAVYTGGTLGSLTLIVANDDSEPGVVTTSVVDLEAVAGTTYHIAVDGFRGLSGSVATGAFNLAITLASTPPPGNAPANDNFANAATLTGSNVTITASNVGATKESGEITLTVDGSSVWWKWTAPAAGTVTVTTVGSSFNTVLNVYTGAAGVSLSAATFITLNNDITPVFDTDSLVTFTAIANNIYYISVDGFGGATGDITLAVSLAGAAPANDNLANAITLTGDNPTTTADSTNATKQVGEPNHSGNSGGASLWWKWTAPSAGEVRLTSRAGTGSSFTTLLGAYTGTGSSLSALTPVSSFGTVIGSNLSRINFAAIANQTYFIAVDGVGGASGNLTLELDFTSSAPPPPTGSANDNFADGIIVLVAGNGSASVTGNNANATKEAGEPNHAGAAGGASLWWSWRPAFDGTATLTTSGTTFDTLLGVYTGSSLGSLVQVASAGGAGAASAVSFNVSADVLYRIAVDGLDGATGDVSLGFTFDLPSTTPPVTPGDGPLEHLLTMGAVNSSGNPTRGNGNREFQLMDGLAIDPSGNVWVLDLASDDATTNKLKKFDSAGNFLLSVTSPISGNGPGQFGQRNAQDITTDSLGNVWLAEQEGGGSSNPIGGQLQKFDTNGNFVSVFPFNFGANPPSTNANISGCSVPCINTMKTAGVDSVGNVWVGEALQLLKFDAQGNYLLRVGRVATAGFATSGDGNGEFLGIKKIYIDGADNVWVTDVGSNDAFENFQRVQKFDSNGNFLLKFGAANFSSSTRQDGEFAGLRGIAVDSSGNAWVTDSSANNIQKFDPNGNFLFRVGRVSSSSGAGISGADDGHFWVPGNIDVDSSGNVWVQDTNNRRLQKFREASTTAPPADPPANDNVAAAIALNGFAATVAGSNIDATKQAGEPNHGGDAGGASVWWTWTAPAAGSVTVSTLGSTFDTTLSVYTGTGVATLTLVAASNDASAGVQTSLVTFQSVSGVAYSIAVDGLAGATGDITLSVNGQSAAVSSAPLGNDLVLNFGAPIGVFAYLNDSTFLKINAGDPNKILVADVDGNGVDDVIADFGAGLGLFIRRNNGAWEQYNVNTATHLAAADLDNDGKLDVLTDFGPGVGIWVRMNDAAWSRFNVNTSGGIISGDMDGNGQTDVIVHLGVNGTWAKMNNATWIKQNVNVSERMLLADLDGNGLDELVMDFGAAGIWAKRNNATWERLNTNTSEGLAAGDIDGDGKQDLIVDLGSGVGLWARKLDGTWARLNINSPGAMAFTDFDGNGKDDLVLDFGAGVGTWSYRNDATWVRINVNPSRQIAGGQLDGQ